MKHKYITYDNIKSSLYYNRCLSCQHTTDLNECNNCLELYCTACDLLIYNWCNYCKYRYRMSPKNCYKTVGKN
jgi:hypothetical protein